MCSQRMEYYLLNVKICALVQKHPCLYDRLSPNYMHKEFIDTAWETISREVGDTVSACKTRWKNIRTAYARSLRPNSGSTSRDSYYLHEHLTFLNAHILHSNSNELNEEHRNSSQSIDISYDSCTYQINLVSPSPTPTASDEEEAQESEHVITPEPEIKTEPEPEQNLEIEPENNPKQKPNYSDSEQPTHSKKRSRENISEDFPSAKGPTKRDLDSEFLNSLLPEIKSMNSRQKILFKGKIFQALEEVFSDSRDFPQNDQSLIVSGTKSDQSTLSTERNLVRRSYGKNVFTDRKEKPSQESQKTGGDGGGGGSGGITVHQLPQPQSSNENNIVIKQELIDD